MQALHLTVVDEWYEDRYIVVYDISEPGEIKECEVLDLTCTMLTSKGDTLYYVRMEGYGEVLKFYQKTVGQCVWDGGGWIFCVDTAGNKKVYFINLSGMDDSLLLTEITLVE